jgi:hypothetical protein
MALARVRVNRRPAVDQGVEEREGAVEAEALGPHLQHQERRVARRLDVQRDELGLVEQGLIPDLKRVDGDLLPGHRPAGTTGLEEQGLGAHLAIASARRAHAISSFDTARSRRIAAQ